MDITWIILGIIAVILSVGLKLVVPYWKSKKTAEEWAVIVEKTATITKWIITGVKAAEMFFAGSGLGEQKNGYVLAFVKSLCEKVGMTFNEDAVAAEIEEVGQDLGLWGVDKNEVKSE